MISLSRLKEMVEEEMENKIKDLEQKLKHKEQECETLASQLDFEVQKKECLEQECEEFRKANDEKNELLAKLGCPTIATARKKVFCLQEQLDQLKAELEAYKMEAEEGKEINAELKAECENWKSLCKYADKQIDELQAEVETLQQLKDEDSLRITQLATENLKLKQTLTEIKEIVTCPRKIETTFNINNWIEIRNNILQKISEVEE